MAKQPFSNVTPLRTPLHSRPDQVRFELQAPSLLNELLAHLKFKPDSRFPTKAQRKALLRRDRYCCRTPGCTNHLFLEIHHIKRYSQGGKTLPQLARLERDGNRLSLGPGCRILGFGGIAGLLPARPERAPTEFERHSLAPRRKS